MPDNPEEDKNYPLNNPFIVRGVAAEMSPAGSKYKKDYWGFFVDELMLYSRDSVRTNNKELYTYRPILSDKNDEHKGYEVVSRLTKKPLRKPQDKKGFTKFLPSTYVNPKEKHFCSTYRESSGLRFDLKDTRINRIFYRDGQSTNRLYYDYDSRPSAHELKQKGKCLPITKLSDTHGAPSLTGNQYNEILTRFRFNNDGSTQVIIGKNNMKSRLLSLARAIDLGYADYVTNKMSNLNDPESISTPPISTYYADENNNPILSYYTEEKRKKDLYDANRNNYDIMPAEKKDIKIIKLTTLFIEAHNNNFKGLDTEDWDSIITFMKDRLSSATQSYILRKYYFEDLTKNLDDEETLNQLYAASVRIGDANTIKKLHTMDIYLVEMIGYQQKEPTLAYLLRGGHIDAIKELYAKLGKQGLKQAIIHLASNNETKPFRNLITAFLSGKNKQQVINFYNHYLVDSFDTKILFSTRVLNKSYLGFGLHKLFFTLLKCKDVKNADILIEQTIEKITSLNNFNKCVYYIETLLDGGELEISNLFIRKAVKHNPSIISSMIAKGSQKLLQHIPSKDIDNLTLRTACIDIIKKLQDRATKINKNDETRLERMVTRKIRKLEEAKQPKLVLIMKEAYDEYKNKMRQDKSILEDRAAKPKF